MPVNGLVMHVGFLHAWPNDADAGRDERIELSHSRESRSVTARYRHQPSDASTKVCRQCNLIVPSQLDECDNCGHDFAAARAASIARWRQAHARLSRES